jgi:hypothetical protein
MAATCSAATRRHRQPDDAQRTAPAFPPAFAPRRRQDAPPADQRPHRRLSPEERRQAPDHDHRRARPAHRRPAANKPGRDRGLRPGTRRVGVEEAGRTRPRHAAAPCHRQGRHAPALLDGEAEVRVLPGANRVRWVGERWCSRHARGRPRPAWRCVPCKSVRWRISASALPASPAGSTCRAETQPVVGADALGQLQQARRHPRQLAPDPPADPTWRLRGRPRSRPPAGNEPQQALLGRGRIDLPGLEDRARRTQATHHLATYSSESSLPIL